MIKVRIYKPGAGVTENEGIGQIGHCGSPAMAILDDLLQAGYMLELQNLNGRELETNDVYGYGYDTVEQARAKYRETVSRVTQDRRNVRHPRGANIV